MNLPVGSRQRAALKASLANEIAGIADAWERAREETALLNAGPAAYERFHRQAEKLARAVRKWRRL